MCLLIETIKISNRRPLNIKYNNERFNRSRKELFGIESSIYLENEIQIPENLTDKIYKCRIIYGKQIEKIEFELYKPKIIRSLKLVEDNDIEYGYKFSDRSKINELFEQRGGCDDVLIVKNGFVTDTSIANIIFWDGVKWITPSTALLRGTARQRLIDNKSIFEKEITVKNLHTFKKIRIINSMMEQELNGGVIK